jgi:Ca2+-binding RTX toxin-like protein
VPTYNGTSGNDTITGSASDDTLNGLNGNDILYAGAGNDRLYGGGGDDTLIGGGGADRYYGGTGNDVVDYTASTAAVVVSLAAGSGTGGHAAGNLLYGIEGLIGSSFDDSLTGSSAANILDGGSGNDTLIGGGGADSLFGGAGSDMADYTASGSAVTVNLATGTGTGGDAAGDVLSGIENLTGSANSDSLTGDANANQLYGGNGNDTLIGGGGVDSLYGGSGSDMADYTASAAGVSVNLATGTGTGGDAAGDILAAIENLTGSAFNDSLTGDTAANQLFGGIGNDTLIGGGGADSLYGGLGTDLADYTASTAAVTVNLATGAGTGGDAADDILSGVENLTGSGFNDSLTGDANANQLVGGNGNDTLIGGGGADTLSGDAGTDMADYSASAAAVTVNLATGTGSGGDAAGDILSAIENLTGSGFNDSLTGDTAANQLYGGNGNDTLIGGGGADSLYGGAGTDTADYTVSTAAVTLNLAAGTGSGGDAAGDVLSAIENLLGSSFADNLTGDTAANILTGAAGADSLYGGAGADSLYGGNDNDLLVGGAGSDRIEGGSGIDTADYSASTAAVNVNLGSGTGSGGDAGTDTLVGVENIFGSVFNDSLYGDSGNNFISGGAGNDYIDTGAGDDTLHGGAGRDTLYGGSGMDFLDYSDSNAGVSINLATNAASGGHATGDVLAGVDGVYGSAFNDTLLGFDFAGLSGDIFTNIFFGGGGQDYIDAGGANDELFGGIGNDTLLAGTGDDVASGGDGNDSINAGDGNDSAFGGSGNDSIDGGAGNDSVDAGSGNDSVLGGLGNDSISGGDGDDLIYGGVGNDLLYGGAGNDILEGGSGSDVFYVGSGDTVYGGLGDNDQLVITGTDPYKIFKNPAVPGSGYVEFYDAFGVVIGTLTFSGIESGITCFTPGTMVQTDRGPRAIETLTPGDRVATRDNGFQPIRWIGAKTLGPEELRADPTLQPVLIRRGAMGSDLPLRDMMVSRQHCMLASGPRAALYFGEDEVFVRALHLVGQPGVLQAVVPAVTYLHLMFDRHEVIMADGVWSESFLPAARALGSLDDDQRDELFKLFPQMPDAIGPDSYASARLTLKAHEARLLLTESADQLCAA